MYKTEKEIFSQYEALARTYDYMESRKSEITGFIKANAAESLTFIGCGSSYSLCKSAEISAKMKLGVKVNAIAAGDLMMNFPMYEGMLKNSLIIAPSRSGSTSEVVLAVTKAKQALGVKCISLSMVTGSRLSEIADISIELPWAFDESVCQTRTVTNLYLADLMLVAYMAGDDGLAAELKTMVAAGKAYMAATVETLKEIAAKDWKKVVVLADAELEGIAEEGALAFNEICMLPSNYYHLLDVRHGPMVLINPETLVIAAATPYGGAYQQELIRDLKAKGATVLAAVTASGDITGADYRIELPAGANYAVSGIPFIFIPQVLSFYKSLARGTNPDEPTGLDPWIKL